MLREKKEWPPKVPGALPMAPKHLYFMPWKTQLQFLNPEAAKALREKMQREEVTWSRMVSAEAEAKRGWRG